MIPISDHYVFLLLLFSGMGCFGACILIFFYLLFRKEMKGRSTRKVVYMSLCDLGIGLIFIIFSLHQDKPSQLLCKINGTALTFFWTASYGWYFAILVSVYFAVSGRNLDLFRQRSINLIQHLSVWGFSSIVCLTFYLYGEYDSKTFRGAVCFLDARHHFFEGFILIPILLDFFFAIFLFFYVIFGQSVIMESSNGDVRYLILRRIAIFVWVFLLSRFGNLLASIMRAFGESNSINDIIRFAEAMGLAGSGVFNCIVWITSPAVMYVLRIKLFFGSKNSQQLNHSFYKEIGFTVSSSFSLSTKEVLLFIGSQVDESTIFSQSYSGNKESLSSTTKNSTN